ncbi:hypothetical protein LTR17_001263 [Elasticomyces elasticus]|nr:hypothetical protein LTR17_001263 [Elasticomyces elasticus]
MEGTSQNKTLEDVCGMLSTLAKSQAELTCTVSELTKVLKDNTAAVKQLTTTLEAKDGKATRNAEVTTKDAGTRLTNTYELLEQILLDADLPMETVFFAQRVNKQFHSLIRRSKGLQQKLFLQPIDFPENPASRRYVPLDGEIHINPLFSKRAVYESLPMFLAESHRRLTNDNDGTDRLEVLKPRIYTNTSSIHGHKYAVLDMKYGTQTIVSKTLSTTGIASSWMQMYLTQPPAEVRCVVSWENCGPEDYHATETSINLKMGQVMQTVCGYFKYWIK